MKSLIYKIMTRITRWLDPKLERFRPEVVEIPYVPESRKDFDDLLKRTPHDILSVRERKMIQGLLSAEEKTAIDFMLPKKEMVFVKTTDSLGPVMLNRLHKSGKRDFPVMNDAKQICGVLHADIFDIEKVSEDSSITRYIDQNIVYVREDYSTEMIFAALLRSKSSYCLVLDDKMRIKGCISLAPMIAKILGTEITDDFDDDFDAVKVATRENK